MLTETITWHEVTEQLPDTDQTVLVRTRNGEDEAPVWLGYLDGDEWRDVDGLPITVVRWAQMPQGGPDGL